MSDQVIMERGAIERHVTQDKVKAMQADGWKVYTPAVEVEPVTESEPEAEAVTARRVSRQTKGE